MRYLEMRCDGKTFVDEKEINQILQSKKFYWLIDSEIDNAIIEIKKETIIWHSGDFYSGKWRYGIFKGGSFYGTWESGIFENGIFDGKWIDGIKL
jgi:hypothetical protein